MPEARVFVVDDDAAARSSIAFLAESVGWSVAGYASAEEFLAALRDDWWGCLVLDVRMPAMSGIELQRALRSRGADLAIVFITGHGEVGMAVQAMKDGALDFLEKPFKDQQLLDAIARGMRAVAGRRADDSRQSEYRSRLARLTVREREVAELVARGLSNKLIARELGISDKTVQVHRGNLMEKLDVHSAVELAQLFHRAGPPE